MHILLLEKKKKKKPQNKLNDLSKAPSGLKPMVRLPVARRLASWGLSLSGFSREAKSIRYMYKKIYYKELEKEIEAITHFPPKPSLSQPLHHSAFWMFNLGV